MSHTMKSSKVQCSHELYQDLIYFAQQSWHISSEGNRNHQDILLFDLWIYNYHNLALVYNLQDAIKQIYPAGPHHNPHTSLLKSIFIQSGDVLACHTL